MAGKWNNLFETNYFSKMPGSLHLRSRGGNLKLKHLK